MQRAVTLTNDWFSRSLEFEHTDSGRGSGYGSDLMPTLNPSNTLVASFSLVVVAVAVAQVLSVAFVADSPKRFSGPAALAASLVIAAWLAFTGAVAPRVGLVTASPVLQLLLLCLVPALLAIGVAASPYGAKLSTGLSLGALVGIHAFRLPLGLTMHRAFVEGLVSVPLSYSGQNYDILIGALAAALGLWSFKRSLSPRLVRLFNIVGIALMCNLVLVAGLLLAQGRAGEAGKADAAVAVWMTQLPFSWLFTFLVPSALLGHLLILRRLVHELRRNLRPRPPRR